MPVERSDLPTGWKFPIELDDQMRGLMPVDIPGQTWWRVHEDFGRGFPAFHIEHAWVADQDLNFATVAGLTFADDFDGVDETEVLDRRRVPLASIVQIHTDLVPGGNGTVTLSDGTVHDDWPVLLINQNR